MSAANSSQYTPFEIDRNALASSINALVGIRELCLVAVANGGDCSLHGLSADNLIALLGLIIEKMRTATGNT